MKKIRQFLFATGMLAGFSMHAQLNFADVQYWVGTGTDTAMLVVDFQDGSWDQSYAWGYLYNGPATAEDMLNDIAAADVNFSVVISSGFLLDVTYGTHAGLGGNPDYWSTWSGTSTATFMMNGGISAQLANGDWFGCSYTDFSPALEPTEPIAAFEPFRFTAEDVITWVGTGTDTTLVIIDFLDGSGASSFGWGYLHNGPVTAETMLNDIDAADAQLNLVITSGFLLDITYNAFAGLGGNPDYWGTWSATNLGNWNMNMGVSTLVGNGDIFGCSYMNFSPVVRPGYPAPASPTTGIAQSQSQHFSAYPVPANDVLYVNTGITGTQVITLSNIAGERVWEKQSASGMETIDVSALPAGMYILQTGTAQQKIVIE